jgi:hypothetical protein
MFAKLGWFCFIWDVWNEMKLSALRSSLFIPGRSPDEMGDVVYMSIVEDQYA